jgi:sigma-E factor negative regulatory protein RseA
MTIKGDRFTDRAEWLSALADGELAPTDVPTVCADWRDDASMRSRWHAYQLIGDVLRSEDLATPAGHDSDFMASLRRRLEAEPVVLAPAPLATSVAGDATDVAVGGSLPRRRGWFVPSAVAATFAAVVVGGVMMSPASGPVDSALSDVATVPPRAIPVVSDPNAVPEMPVTTANGRLIRDARLDRYLSAHQQWSGGAVIGGHAAYMRQVAVDAPSR